MSIVRHILLALAIVATVTACSGRTAGTLDTYLFVCGSQTDPFILNLHIFVLDQDESRTVAVPIADPTYDGSYMWSPDGSKVLIGDRHILTVESMEIFEFPMPGRLRGWSPDGQWVWLFEPEADRLLRVRPDGTGPQLVAEVVVFADPVDASELLGPYVSADGQRMAWYGQDPATLDSTALFIQDLPDGLPREVECEGMSAGGPSFLAANVGAPGGWSADGRHVFWIAGNCGGSFGNVIKRCDMETGEVATVAQATEKCMGSFRLAPNGRHLVHGTLDTVPTIESFDLYAVDLEVGDTVQLTHGWSATVYAWTYDSKYILISGDDHHGLSGYFTVSVPGGRIREVAVPQDAGLGFICSSRAIVPCPVARRLPERE